MPEPPRVDVITPVMDPDPAFLLDSHDDLCAQEVAWRWLLHVDGASVDLPPSILADPRVHVAANGRWLGVALTRNRALTRVTADLVYAHDYDDRLAPGAFAAPLLADETLGWSAGAFDDLVLDGDGRWRHVPFRHHLSVGRVPAGTVDVPADVEAVSPTPAPSSIMWRADWLFALGGWGALTSGEDSFVVHPLQLLADGYYVDAQIGWYRKHPAQSTQSANVIGDREMYRRLVARRVQAIERLGWTATNRDANPRL